MTATEVDGVQVIEVRRIPTPLHTAQVPMYYKRMMELVLNETDETDTDFVSVFGCVECDFADGKLGNVRNHLKVHKTDYVASDDRNDKPSVSKIDLKKLTVQELVDLAARAEQHRQTAAAWKIRATEAEKALSALGKALKGIN